MVPSQFNSRLDGVDINPGLTLFRKKITKNECVTPCPSLLFQHPSETILFGGLEQDFIFPYIGNNNPNWLSFFRRGRYTTNQYRLVWGMGLRHMTIEGGLILSRNGITMDVDVLYAVMDVMAVSGMAAPWCPSCKIARASRARWCIPPPIKMGRTTKVDSVTAGPGGCGCGKNG